MALISVALLPPGNPATPTESPVYTSMETAENAQEQNLITGDNQFELVCYAGQTNEYCAWQGWVTDATHTITIRANVGDECNGVPRDQGGTGYKIKYTGDSAAVLYFYHYGTIQDIETEETNENGALLLNTTDGSEIRLIQRCILGMPVQGPGGAYTVRAFGASATANIFNNYIYSLIGAQDGSLGLEVEDSNGEISNNICLCNSQAFKGNGSTLFKNNAAISVATNYLNFSASSTNNAGNLTGPFGLNYIPSLVTTDGVDWVSPSTQDFNVVPTTSKLFESGIDNSSAGYSDDIANNARIAPWEVGAWEIAGAAGAVLDTPTIADLAETTVTIGCSTDTAGGTLYWYVSTSATPPSAVDLKAGTGSAAGGTAFGNQVPGATGAQTAGVTALTADTDYWHYWIQDTV